MNTNWHEIGMIPPFTQEKYRRYLPSAFDSSLDMYEQVVNMIEYVNKLGLLTNDLINIWNEFHKWIINEGIKNAIDKKLDDMVADGSLAELINQKMLGDLLKEVTNALARMDVQLYETMPFYANYQKIVGTTPTTLEGQADFIQGFAYNTKNKEYYVARQINGGTTVTITRYSQLTHTEIDHKVYNKSTGAYAEGLPYFYNEQDELCFFVRTTYDKKLVFRIRT